MFEVELYVMENGNCPVKDFLDSLPIDLRTKAARSLLLLQQEGNRLREPYSKPIKD